jgi:hypothetical protein
VIPPAWQPLRGLEAIGDGTLLTSVARARSDIWLMEGFAGLASTLRGRWPW